MSKFFLLMIGMEFFYRVKVSSLIIRIAGKSIHKSIYLSYFWDKMSPKITILSGWSHKKSTIFEKISPHTILAHGGITNIAISDIHSILWPESISDRKCDLLIPNHEPWMMPEIMIISNKRPWDQESDEYSPSPWVSWEKICHHSNWCCHNNN